jgi:hypothetical protein
MPRLWFGAWLGVWWNISIGLLVFISVASIGIAVAVYATRRVAMTSNVPAPDLAATEAVDG